MEIGNILLASLPIAALLVLLLLFHQTVVRAAAIGLVLAAGTAVFCFGETWEQIGIAFVKGAKDSLPIVLVVFSTLFLYVWSERSGVLRRLQDALFSCSRDVAVQALFIGWLFVHALQGISGFGVPVLVGAPLLVKLGLSPFRAVLIALLGQCWGNTFGTLGLAWDGLFVQATLDAETIHAAMTAASSCLLIVCVVTGFLIAYIAAGTAGVRRTFWGVLVLGLLQGEGQTILAFWSPELANFAASMLGIGAFLAWRKLVRRLRRPEHSAEGLLGNMPEKKPAAVVFWQRGFMPAFLRYAARRTWSVAAAIILLLAMSEIMAAAGETKVLATGMAALTGQHYLLAAPFVGLVGAFMTASNLSSNLLFAPFQQQMAFSLGLPVAQLFALQTAGGAVGTLLSPSNIFLGTTAAQITGAEGEILNRTLPVAIFFCVLFSLSVLF